MPGIIHEILTDASGRLIHSSETPSLDAQVLMAHVLHQSRSWVVSHPEVTISEAQYARFKIELQRLEHGEPLPYLIGHWEFFGLDFCLTPEVLIPRPETELLVERGIQWLELHPNARKALDVGTGSGCIAVSLAMHIAELQVLMTDISLSALEVARVNVEKYNLTDRLDFQQADLLEGIVGSFDLICANLPYIPREKLYGLRVAQHEPQLALNGGENGLGLISRLLQGAVNHLAPYGLLLVEFEASQASELISLASGLFPMARIAIKQDLSGSDRMLEIEVCRMILHICRKEEWNTAITHGAYASESLSREGFIHCSTSEQVLHVADRFYRQVTDLVLLWIDVNLLASELRWEPSDGACYPHVYGPINLAAITAVTDLVMEHNGNFHLIQPPG